MTKKHKCLSHNIPEYSTVPDAGQPVSDEGEGAHQKEEDSCSVLRVAIQFSGYTDQSQESSGFQQTDQSGGLVGRGKTHT